LSFDELGRALATKRKGATMGRPIVHFEIIGQYPHKLRGYYGDLFGWKFDTSALVAKPISERGNYGFVNRDTTDDGSGFRVALVEARATTAMRSSMLAFPTSESRSREPST
jgi:hypothetical protein